MKLIILLLLDFPELVSLTVELEDCVGEGFVALLEARGEHIR